MQRLKFISLLVMSYSHIHHLLIREDIFARVFMFGWGHLLLDLIDLRVETRNTLYEWSLIKAWIIEPDLLEIIKINFLINQFVQGNWSYFYFLFLKSKDYSKLKRHCTEWFLENSKPLFLGIFFVCGFNCILYNTYWISIQYLWALVVSWSLFRDVCVVWEGWQLKAVDT